MIRHLTETDLIEEGETLGRSLPPGAVLLFAGDLGSGKTTFIKAIARGLGVQRPATSPTYALVHRYRGRRGPVFHVDCYRLRHPDEALDLDFAGVLRVARLLLIEWPEHAGAYAPAPNAHLHFTHGERVEKRRVERLR